MALILSNLSLMGNESLTAFVIESLPVTALDLDRNAHHGAPANVDMFDPMADLCPACGGNCMCVGDYVCWGICSRCYRSAYSEVQ